MEGKIVSVKAKALTVEKGNQNNRDQNELKDLRQQIESLAMIMKSATVGSNKPKMGGGVSSNRKKVVSGNSPWKPLHGSPRKIKGSLKPGQKPIKCCHCDGWGHGWLECPIPENLNWRELVRAAVPSSPTNPGFTPMQTPNQNP